MVIFDKPLFPKHPSYQSKPRFPQYTTIEQEFEDSLRHAFVYQKADFIFYDSRRQVFLAECVNYGIYKGWLTGFLNEIEEQYSRFEVRLTPEGKRHFGLL